MTEGSQLPRGWRSTILQSGVERIIVPCEHNAVVFRETGLPVHVIAGGTDPGEFPFRGDHRTNRTYESYTFLSLADRGARKGWVEVWQAFYRAFGPPDETSDVRLIIKSRPDGNDMLELIRKAEHPDPRITILMDDMDMREFYAMGDCYAAPSRSEGWGMTQREACCQGLPVIVQAHAGLDDGHTHEWAIVVEGGKLEPIPGHFEHIAGEWMKADTEALARMMRMCYERPHMAAHWGAAGALWLRENQTWAHSAKMLIELIGEYHGVDQ
jgi:glycosyltransferase involved in cell wall biosynthesis